jgi:hypothetical protein
MTAEWAGLWHRECPRRIITDSWYYCIDHHEHYANRTVLGLGVTLDGEVHAD